MKGVVEFKRFADESAVAAIMDKAVGPRYQFDYRDMTAAEHAASFVVAKAMRQDVLDILAKGGRTAIAEGRTPKQFIDELTPLLQKAGWWGRQSVTDPVTGEVVLAQLGSARRLDLIYDTNMRMAHAAGRWERFVKQADLFPYLRYVAVKDDRTRPEHLRWHGTMLPVDHPFWLTHYPPNGWRCRCRVQQVTTGQAQREGWKVTSEAEVAKRMGEADVAVNKRTGALETIFPGIDPGFAHNAGIARMDVLRDRVRREPDFDLTTSMDAAKSALFTKKLGPRDVARALLAGTPESVSVDAQWAVASDGLEFSADAPGMKLVRTFRSDAIGWIVHHDWFKIASEYRGKGHAKAMLLAALDIYDRLGVVRIEVQAALESGAYVWARYGFAPDNPNEMRAVVANWARKALDGDDLLLMLATIDEAPEDEIMWRVANLQRGGRKLGELVLVGNDKSWYGHLDLKNKSHRTRLGSALK